MSTHIRQFFSLFALVLLTACGNENTTDAQRVLNGGGASFPAPVYQVWTFGFSESQDSVRVNYQSIGSGAGLAQLQAETLDFAGSDQPLDNAALDKARWQQIPMLCGGVTVIYNVPGVKNLRLDPATLSALFRGEITRWNDSRIAALNPGKNLPDLAVSPVHRSDGSGTTFIFTDYLSKVSPEWRETIGSGTAVQWPCGTGGQKNPGVCNTVARIQGAIGYTEYVYAREAQLQMATLQNSAGKMIEPNTQGFAAAARGGVFSADSSFSASLNNMSAPDAYPIMGVTYLLFSRDLSAEKRASLQAYVTWCYTQGAATAQGMDYVPLPRAIAERAERVLDAKK